MLLLLRYGTAQRSLTSRKINYTASVCGVSSDKQPGFFFFFAETLTRSWRLAVHRCLFQTVDTAATRVGTVRVRGAGPGGWQVTVCRFSPPRCLFSQLRVQIQMDVMASVGHLCTAFQAEKQQQAHVGEHRMWPKSQHRG